MQVGDVIAVLGIGSSDPHRIDIRRGKHDALL